MTRAGGHDHEEVRDVGKRPQVDPERLCGVGGSCSRTHRMSGPGVGDDGRLEVCPRDGGQGFLGVPANHRDEFWSARDTGGSFAGTGEDHIRQVRRINAPIGEQRVDPRRMRAEQGEDHAQRIGGAASGLGPVRVVVAVPGDGKSRFDQCCTGRIQPRHQDVGETLLGGLGLLGSEHSRQQEVHHPCGERTSGTAWHGGMLASKGTPVNALRRIVARGRATKVRGVGGEVAERASDCRGGFGLGAKSARGVEKSHVCSVSNNEPIPSSG